MSDEMRKAFRDKLRSLAYFYGGSIKDVAEECEELVRLIREREEREARYVHTVTEPGLYHFDGTGFTPYLVDEAPRCPEVTTFSANPSLPLGTKLHCTRPIGHDGGHTYDCEAP